uniref:Uncharacterized protein n=1 Tax=Tanacetum cinerariifolium TaxID=118510 RepID=A0A699GN41_TANCI|nr:hypothetical protein [Tanacetum cinerariifolium]
MGKVTKDIIRQNEILCEPRSGNVLPMIELALHAIKCVAYDEPSKPVVNGSKDKPTKSANKASFKLKRKGRFIRCWDPISCHEVYMITIGLGGLGGGSELCIWRGTLMSADSSGNVQFWDSLQGTLLQAHSFHKGDVNALATSTSHIRVFLLDLMVSSFSMLMIEDLDL